MPSPQTVICTFRVKKDSHDAFLKLLGNHWPMLHRLGFVTDTPEQAFLSHENDLPTVVSIFEWSDDGSAGRAHEHPDVAEVWEAMGPLCETRNGYPSMEFPHFAPITLSNDLPLTSRGA